MQNDGACADWAPLAGPAPQQEKEAAASARVVTFIMSAKLESVTAALSATA